MIKKIAKKTLSQRSITSLKFDWLRFKARLKAGGKRYNVGERAKLHLGCGGRIVKGWVNVDVAGSDIDVDLGGGRLPFENSVFVSVVCQHVIEHLDIESELIPLLQELRRVSREGAVLWFSTPDMRRVAEEYHSTECRSLVEDRVERFPYRYEDFPSQQMMNHYFHQGSEHKNLFDFSLLKWLLECQGFGEVESSKEEKLLEENPEFPERKDGFSTLYVRFIRP